MSEYVSPHYILRAIKVSEFYGYMGQIMLFVITFLLAFGASSGSCPAEELISPACTCREIYGGDLMIACSNILNDEALVDPIRSTVMSGRKIFSLDIRNSTLRYIPHRLLYGTGMKYIRIEDSELMSLSDTDIAFEGLEDTLIELRVTDARYVSHWDWGQLRNLKKLSLIDANRISLGSVPEPFPEFKELTALGISNAQITDIATYAFAKLQNLQILSLKDNYITELARNMFPNNLIFLDLSGNELETLPNDIFREMPKLKNVYLDNNLFITLSEDIFKESFLSLNVLSVKENKIMCDCRLQWSTEIRKPNDYIGSCIGPQALAGRKLSSLDFKELWC